MKEYKCFNCGNSESEMPLLKLRYKTGEMWVCPQCMPVLIHKTDIIVSQLQNNPDETGNSGSQ